MKKILLMVVFTMIAITQPLSAKPVSAKKAFNGENFSGVYRCKGENEIVGDYEVFINLKLNRLNSYGNVGIYDFKTQTVNDENYFGQAIAHGRKIAVTFKLNKAVNAEYSTGIGSVRKLGKHQWAFTNNYYEPDDNGGNVGSEYCKSYIPQ